MSYPSLPPPKTGEQAILRCSPNYGYGDFGSMAEEQVIAVPPNATLEFEVELIDWKAAPTLLRSNLRWVLNANPFVLPVSNLPPPLSPFLSLRQHDPHRGGYSCCLFCMGLYCVIALSPAVSL